jgi:hypothetical protein
MVARATDLVDFRNWHFRDMRRLRIHVRLRGKSGHAADTGEGPGLDPFRTSDGNASPGLRARELAPESAQGQSHCRRKLTVRGRQWSGGNS